MSYKKKFTTLRHQLIGAQYHHALSAMEYAQDFHIGFRKDGVTPEFQHQVEIGLFALTLPNLMYREAVLATIMLHDVREDYKVTDQELRSIFFNDIVFADRVSLAVANMTKGIGVEEQEMFENMSQCPISSIAKGCDRIHNLQTMVGVFNTAKQKAYIEEVHDLFFPMLKSARRAFPHQVNAYENIKFVLKSQIELIEAIHDANFTS